MALYWLQIILTTLLKVYVRGGLFEKSRELLVELESSDYAEDEVIVISQLNKEGFSFVFSASEIFVNHFIALSRLC